MSVSDASPALAGVHHLKLPVTDLGRSINWYASRLGYRTAIEFIESGTLMGVSMRHPDGGPELALRLDPERAIAAAGFDYFSFAVPDKAAMEALAERLTSLGDEHGGVHYATIGWILPMVHDPDGHEVRFYTVQQHTDFPEGPPMRIEDPRESAERMEAEMAAAALAEPGTTDARTTFDHNDRGTTAPSSPDGHPLFVGDRLSGCSASSTFELA